MILLSDEEIVLKAIRILSNESQFISYQEVQIITALSNEKLNKVLCSLRDNRKIINVQHLGGDVPVIFSIA